MTRLIWTAETVKTLYEYFAWMNQSLEPPMINCIENNYASLFTVTLRFTRATNNPEIEFDVPWTTQNANEFSCSFLITSEIPIESEKELYNSTSNIYEDRTKLYSEVAKKFIALYPVEWYYNESSLEDKIEFLSNCVGKTFITNVMSWNCIGKMFKWQEIDVLMNNDKTYEKMDITKSSQFSLVFNIESCIRDDFTLEDIKSVIISHNLDSECPFVYEVVISEFKKESLRIFTRNYMNMVLNEKARLCMKAMNWVSALRTNSKVNPGLYLYFFFLEISFKKMYCYIIGTLTFGECKCLDHFWNGCIKKKVFSDPDLLVYHRDLQNPSAVFIIPTLVIEEKQRIPVNKLS